MSEHQDLDRRFKRRATGEHLYRAFREVRLAVDAHFNIGLQERAYFVQSIALAASTVRGARFDVQVSHDNRLITCIIKIGYKGDFSGGMVIDAIYYSDNGRPVPGFSKGPDT